MLPAVRAAFHGFSEPLEGRVNYPYLCSTGHVTSAVGVMFPTASSMLALPWKRPDGTPASPAEVIAAYEKVYALQHLRMAGGGAFAKYTTIRLTWDEVDRATERKLDTMEVHLAKLFPAWDLWPADAQLFALSWAWAVGPHAKYPHMVAALRAGDFMEASYECTINPQRGTILERNERNRILLRNAAFVRDKQLDPTVLYWPRQLVDQEAETLREIPNPASEPTIAVDVPFLPVREDDGGASRRSATSYVVTQAASDGVVRRNTGELAAALVKLDEDEG